MWALYTKEFFMKKFGRLITGAFLCATLMLSFAMSGCEKDVPASEMAGTYAFYSMELNNALGDGKKYTIKVGECIGDVIELPESMLPDPGDEDYDSSMALLYTPLSAELMIFTLNEDGTVSGSMSASFFADEGAAGDMFEGVEITWKKDGKSSVCFLLKPTDEEAIEEMGEDFVLKVSLKCDGEILDITNLMSFMGSSKTILKKVPPSESEPQPE